MPVGGATDSDPSVRNPLLTGTTVRSDTAAAPAAAPAAPTTATSATLGMTASTRPPKPMSAEGKSLIQKLFEGLGNLFSSTMTKVFGRPLAKALASNPEIDRGRDLHLLLNASPKALGRLVSSQNDQVSSNVAGNISEQDRRLLLNASPKALSRLGVQVSSERSRLEASPAAQLEHRTRGAEQFKRQDMIGLARNPIARPFIIEASKRRHSPENLAFLDAVYNFKAFCDNPNNTLEQIRAKYKEMMTKFINQDSGLGFSSTSLQVNLPEQQQSDLANIERNLRTATRESLRCAFDVSEREIGKLLWGSFSGTDSGGGESDKANFHALERTLGLPDSRPPT